ncbi:MAG: CheR family methyltransferase, partial [Pyrinomonadaceae bacterium]
MQALKKFFVNVAADSNMAFVVILHLSPDFDSQLTEILQKVAKIPVTQIREKVRVEANHVYVVSPNESLSMQDGHILVSPINTVEERRAPVDIFFRTLAESHGSRAVAVVLSGTGANGSMGIKRIKERGGAAFVQNPQEAEFGEMPRNSIATELIDEVLNVAEIPAKIVAYRKNLGKIVIPIEPESREEEQHKALRDIFMSLRVRTGHDFANYKRATVLRRIERRINVRELPNLPEYAVYLKENPDEIQALLRDLLISVTNFFRDKEAFLHLERDVLPRILTDKKSGDEIRIWVAGCATGEEAYSLAMLFCEQIERLPETPSVQIFATDIDEDAIAAARYGFYTLNDAADVSPERLKRFFTQKKHGFRVRRELREMILFANHNLLKDPPFSRLDLAACRNLLIYFNRTAQERVLETFHFALKPNGYLFLGTSESIDGAGDLYSSFNREERIFCSRQTSPRIAYPVPDLSLSLRYDKLPNAERHGEENKTSERVSYGDLHGRILEQFAPPSIVVNAQYDIVHVSENAGRFLQISGELSPNLFKLIQPELRLPVSTAVYRAVQNKANVSAENLRFQNGSDQPETVNVSVRPVLNQINDAADGFILIIFESSENALDAIETEEISTDSEPIARQLEKELMRSNSRFQTSIENSEIQAEELKASNEELQAINEELRSTTEELETGKEELQSVNEELVTVNQELKIKIEELSQSNNDLQNLINSTRIGTIFLDRSGRVKMFTPIAGEIFNLIPADNGRLLSDITHKLGDENLIADVETVLRDLKPVEREVSTADGSFYLMQITPYRTAEDRIGGTIVTFVNITGRIRAERELSESLEKL